MTETNTKKGFFIKILFIIGIIVLIFIFAYALFKIVPKVFSGFAAVGEFITSPLTSNSLKVSSNQTNLNSGDKFILNWKYTPKKAGDYNISYNCQEDLTLQINSIEGPKTLLCNTKYNLKNTNSAELTVNLKKQNIFVDLPIKIEYLDSDNKNVIASGSIDLNVKNETSNANNTIIVSESISNNTSNNTGAGNSNTNQVSTSNYYGPADLAVTNAYALNDNTITFTVTNIGGQASGVWYFDYVSPNRGTESSPLQVSLSSGQGIRFTLNLNSNTGRGNLAILVDPKNTIYENNKLNNVATIYVNGNNNSYYYNDNSYNRNHRADLEIKDFEVGRISNSGRFTEDDEINESEDAAVRFTVKNIGGESTGSWRYEITNLPYDNDDSEESNLQSSLRPGESREIIVGFRNPDKGTYNIKVKVDSDNDIREESESNNTESARLEVRD
jgi:subtilase family serine protease